MAGVHRGRPRSTWMFAGKLGAFVSSYRIENLADAVRVDSASVYRWMRGESSPSVENAIAITLVARAAGTPLTLEDIYATEVNTIRVRMRSSLT
jgi:DNA-binding XRE family transcriptional regulator